MQCKLFSNSNIIIDKNEYNMHTMDSPMQIRLINFLGLKSYLMEKLIFRRKPSTYRIRTCQGQVKLYTPRQYRPPLRYDSQIKILKYQNHSIPVIKLTPRSSKNKIIDTIIYAHGNSSDLADGLKFIERLSLKYQAQYVIFDYNGYGQSKNSEVGEQMICKDLEVVVSWLNKPLDSIILWGFSLGSFPVVSIAAKYPIKAIILQCPIGSASCFFQQTFEVNLKFKEDYFANIDLIAKVKGKIFLMHSTADEIIPISHAQLLFDKYVKQNGLDNIYFVEVMKLSHNGVHKYIISQKINDLQKQLFQFLKQIQYKPQQDELSPIDSRLKKIFPNIKDDDIQQQDFCEDTYELTSGITQKQPSSRLIKLNCFCFSQTRAQGQQININ